MDSPNYKIDSTDDVASQVSPKANLKTMRWKLLAGAALLAAIFGTLGCTVGYLLGERSAFSHVQQELKRQTCEEGLQEVFGFTAGTKLWYLHSNQTGHQGKVYKVFNKQGKSKFEDAEALCGKHQMRLLAIQTQAEQNFMYKILPLYTHKAATMKRVHIQFWTAGKRNLGDGGRWFWDIIGRYNRISQVVDYVKAEKTLSLSERNSLKGRELCLLLRIGSSLASYPVEWREGDCDTETKFYKIISGNELRIPVCEAFLPRDC